MCCRRLTDNTGRKKSRQKSPSRHRRTNLSGYIFAPEARIDNRKKIVKQQYIRHMSSQYGKLGLLAAEICWRVWGTPTPFNGFRVLAPLLHGTLVVGVSHTFRCLTGRHLHSAERPSRWALAHILFFMILLCYIIFWFIGVCLLNYGRPVE